MKTYQSFILDNIQQTIEKHNLEAIISYDYCNKGTVYAVDNGYKTIVKIQFDFQSSYFTVTVNSKMFYTDNDNNTIINDMFNYIAKELTKEV